MQSCSGSSIEPPPAPEFFPWHYPVQRLLANRQRLDDLCVAGAVVRRRSTILKRRWV